MQQIKFSFVIALAPYRDAEVVKYLKQLDYPKNKYEIIIEKSFNPSENRNKGVAKARGEIILFIDDDAMIEKDFLSNVEQFLKEHPEIDIVGGPQLTPKDEQGFAKISGFALSSQFGAFNVNARYTQVKLKLDAEETDLTSANMICKKDIFQKIAFNPKLWPGEDPDFISQAKKQGLRVAYSPQILVYHRRRSTFSALAKQIFSYGKTRPAKESFLETLKRPYFLVPSAFLLYLLALVALGIFGFTAFVLYIPLLVYFMLSIYFSLFIAVREKNFVAFFLIPIIFLTIHLSYGAGIIVGLIKK